LYKVVQKTCSEFGYANVSVAVRINDTVTFVEDGFDEDIEFGDEVSDEGEGDPVDNVSILLVKMSSVGLSLICLCLCVSICLWNSE
jgi:hypothetical protein